MIDNLKFNAEAVDQIKIDHELKIPQETKVKFEISGECEVKVLRQFLRVIKMNSKPNVKQLTGNKT